VKLAILAVAMIEAAAMVFAFFRHH